MLGHVFTEFLVGHGLGSSDMAVPLAVGLGVLDLVLGYFNENGHNLRCKMFDGRGMMWLRAGPGSNPRQSVSLTMQRYDIAKFNWRVMAG